jgi:hypothetical protein
MEVHIFDVEHGSCDAVIIPSGIFSLLIVDIMTRLAGGHQLGLRVKEFQSRTLLLRTSMKIMSVIYQTSEGLRESIRLLLIGV